MANNWKPVKRLKEEHLGAYVRIEETEDRSAFGYLLCVEGHGEEYVVYPFFDAGEDPWFIKHNEVIQAFVRGEIDERQVPAS